MAWTDRVATAVTEHSALIVLAVVLVTAAVGAGMGMIGEQSSNSGVSGESEVTAAAADVQRNFTARGANTTVTVIAVRDDGGNVLSKDSLLRTLRYQRSLRTNETLAPTLVAERPTVGVANAVARAAIAAERRDGQTARDGSGGLNATAGIGGRQGPPALDEQIARLESMDDDAVAATVERVLDPERGGSAGRTAERLLPKSYEPGSTAAEARLIVVTQETDGQVLNPTAISEPVAEGQTAARSLATSRSDPESYAVVGRGLMGAQQQQAIGDSLAILGPLALAFVLVALSVAYRDPVDVSLGLLGVVVVLVWTFGAMGWLGIEFGQTMIAVPILLIGLSVDYALHVTMRYREERAADEEGVRAAMARSLSAVGPALALVTATTAIGFLANLSSPLGDIRSFGIVTAVGIAATLLVFGLFVPALKTLVASGLARLGWDCTPAPPGSTGRLRRVLGGGATLARRVPLAVLAVALLLSVGGAYGATQVDVAADQELFMADEPPGWTDELPESVAPGEFFLKENRRAVYETFQSPERQGYVLVEGNVTDPETLDRIAAAERQGRQSDAVFVDAGGEPAVETPLSAMRTAAAHNETFNATLTAADADGDGVPDRNLAGVYDEFRAAAPDLAARTVHRSADGEYAALRLRLALDGDTEQTAAVALLTGVADEAERADGVTATATGTPMVDAETTGRVTTTMVEGLGITLAVVLALLAVVFRLREGSASLGAVTLVPVAFTVAWLLGTMALLDIPMSPVTSLVGGISVGLGVDYAIHVSERFAHERRAGATARAAIARTVTGTGSAMLSSAVTTAAGFGVLAFSLLPALRQFGLVLAVGIAYAFVASVYVQPSLLALWSRHGPGSVGATDRRAATADD